VESPDSQPEEAFSIHAVARLTGVREGTLRAWERRYGFPDPRRLEGGHRRYTRSDVDALRRALAERAGGVDLRTALVRAARAPRAAETRSLYAELLRASAGELATFTLAKRTLLPLSRAIEDEASARAERGIVIGAFQRRRFYDASRSRWASIARGAAVAVVLADFERLGTPAGAPAEVPLTTSEPLHEEWAIVYVSSTLAVCLAARERPYGGEPDALRRFDALVSLDAAAAREAVRIVATLVQPASPGLAAALTQELDVTPVSASGGDSAVRVLARTLEYADRRR
jgi:MerR family transcriptional regulator, light-induced transcriptional regulator